MKSADRFQLLGHYRTPRCRVGQWVQCAVRGCVQIVGLSDTPIPWLVCRHNRWLVPVVYQGLLKPVHSG